MGKERHKRKKLHASAPKVVSVDQDDAMSVGEKPKSNTFPLPVLGENIFAGVKVRVDELTPQKLPDFDARSTITSKTFKGMNMKKKDKQKMRHEVWMKKVDALQAAKNEEKAKKKRQKTVIVGDLKPLEDTLPTLELLMKGTGKGQKQAEEKKEHISKKAIRKESVRRKQMLDGIGLFQQVFNHPSFKSNPGAAITEHLKEKMRQEDQMQS
ncbi:ribosome biogenesis protein SLX9 homolog [Lineus longissimus]|uniref:ribosome biogenesis protein SLX9 homolog n=1 Tax=Lineus longissimus TaxID=88925 RepID=UPI002B4E2295